MTLQEFTKLTGFTPTAQRVVEESDTNHLLRGIIVMNIKRTGL